MARAGRGSSGGGSRSGGSRSSSRSSGGHRIGSSSSSRAGRGSFGGGGGSSFGSFGSPRPPRTPRPPRPPRGPGYYGESYYDRPPRPPRRPASTLSTIFAFLIVLTIAAMYMVPFIGGGSSGVSTIERHKLESGNGFENNCITDELGWFENESRTESKLKDFYQETGVQPIILFKKYDASLKNDDDKAKWAEDYYEDYINREDVFLYVYFCEKNESDVGYMCYVNGFETSSVMDSEAVGIFWNNIDRYWYQDISTDEVMIRAFNDTADTIMRVSTTGGDIFKWILIVVAVGGAGFVIIKVMKTKRQHEAEEAKETERILSTPLEKMETDADSLAEKYNS